MGENASTTESSASNASDSKSSDTKTKSKSESKTTVQRTADVPDAKGHGSTGPDALGVDRMADQERKKTERSLGPATVRRMEESGTIDREPSDFQKEASALASRIASDSESAPVDRSPDESGGDSGGDPATVQRSAEGEAASGGDGGEGGPSSLVENVVSSSGGRLDPGVRSEMGSKMGADFSDVRIHTGPTAGKAANAINAKAFTVGNHIGFNHGAFDTSSREGKHTIAHELAHVQQQASETRRMAQRVTEGSGLEVSDPGDVHEREAESVARRVMAGEEVRVDRTTATAHVQRQSQQDSSSSGSSSGSGGDFKSMDDASGIGEAVKVLGENQQKIIEQMNQSGGGSGGSQGAELGTQELVKASSQEAIKAIVSGAIATSGGAAVASGAIVPIVAAVGGATVLGMVMDKVAEDGSLVDGLKSMADKIPGLGGGESQARSDQQSDSSGGIGIFS